ncbi:MAG: glycosyltransferase, partial [Acidobacteriota bacterium]
ARFFLQLSSQEGMAMSVVEAMQLGLVVIVTPVGEIASYCNDMDNGVIYDGARTTLPKVEALLREPGAYRRLSQAAVQTWSHQTLYADDFVEAAKELATAPPQRRETART